MEKNVIVCDFCQREGKDAIARTCCCICGKDYCDDHQETLNVLIEGHAKLKGSIGVRDGIPICPDCSALLTFDNWTCGDQATRAAKYDRTIIKMMLPSVIHAAMQSLVDIRHRIGSTDVKDWVNMQGGKKV